MSEPYAELAEKEFIKFEQSYGPISGVEQEHERAAFLAGAKFGLAAKPQLLEQAARKIAEEIQDRGRTYDNSPDYERVLQILHEELGQP